MDTVHLLKFIDGVILAASEDDSEFGVYGHGLYPFVFDVMFPDEDSPVGFGLIDIAKNPQMYIDKLDQIINNNALISGKQRYMIADNGSVNEDELKDTSIDIIHVQGSLDDTHIRPVQALALPQWIVEHRQNKIMELKEITGNRDFQQGGTSGGVTAASAINALQEQGNKLSRDMIDASYEAFKDIVSMCVEIIRQFFDEERQYRISGEDGEVVYQAFSNEGIKPQPIFSIFGGEETKYRRVEFDIEVSAQPQSPFRKATNNQTIMSLWGSGFFNPQSLDVSLLVLESLIFDGKEKLIEGLRELQLKAQQLQMQQAQQQMMARTAQSMGQATPQELPIDENGDELIPIDIT